MPGHVMAAFSRSDDRQALPGLEHDLAGYDDLEAFPSEVEGDGQFGLVATRHQDDGHLWWRTISIGRNRRSTVGPAGHHLHGRCL